MDTTELLKALARLQAFRQNLPGGNIEEKYVTEYHHILEAIHQQTGQSLQEFLIPAAELTKRVSRVSHPSRSNHFQRQTHYTDSRYCDHEFFLIKLDGAINFINYLLPADTGKRQIGF